MDKAVRFDPHNALVYNNRGLVKRGRGDLQGAIADYDKAIAINPRLAEAYSNRGNARQDRGDLEMSIADYESAIKIDPLFAKAHGNRGLARLFQGDKAGAEMDFAECLRLEPKLKTLAGRTNSESEAQACGQAIRFSNQVTTYLCQLWRLTASKKRNSFRARASCVPR
ncbi:MAG: tetratricopeptide repeat protein [Pyrinomonadaceae bacterium]|nr:tetratricopeptide repeat protein [Pyrinomonadaceae bacterium]